jgi:hypothetical protein
VIAMMTCDEIREMLALQPLIEDAAIEKHLDQCMACTKYQRQHQALDVLLRAELHWEAPTALTERLMALAAAAAAPAEAALLPSAAPQVIAPQAIARPRSQIAPAQPQAWFVTSVYVLTLAIIALSLLVAWQVIGSLTSQVDPGVLLTQLLALPGQGLAYLNQKLPESRYAIDFFLRVRVQLLWLLLVAVLWAVLDKVDLQFSFRGRQITL